MPNGNDIETILYGVSGSPPDPAKVLAAAVRAASKAPRYGSSTRPLKKKKKKKAGAQPEQEKP